MAQYDLLLTQNVHATLTEFSEKYVNLAKGSILSSDASGVPTVLAVGTDSYMLVADSAETTGMKWVVVSGGHTQNTDTGTTSDTFEVSSDGAVGSIIISGASAGGDYSTTIINDTQAGNIILTLPVVTGTIATESYADSLFAANDAMLFKGTIGTAGTHTIVAFNALATYNAGWTYRVIEAGTIKGVVCEIGDMITAMVDRAGTGEVDADWTVMQTNLDGAVIGPASTTDGYLVQFDGTTGKLIKAGTGVPGTMVYETATDYVADVLFDANTMLFATSDNTPVALLGTELPPKLWAEVPVDKIGTGWTGTAVAGQIAYDANWIYVCQTGGTATNQAWTRSAQATNWS